MCVAVLLFQRVCLPGSQFSYFSVYIITSTYIPDEGRNMCRFVGLDSLQLCVGGEWLERHERYLFAYDAGTDSGETYLSPDMPTEPKQPITRFGPDDMGIFFNADEYAPASLDILLPCSLFMV